MRPEVAAFLALARNDLGTARAIIQSFPGNAAFHCQQAAEKLVKAVLVREGIREGIRLHRIGDLAAMLPDEHPWRSELEGLDQFSDAATAYRYPGMNGMLADPPEAGVLVSTIDHIETLLIRIEDWLRSP